MVFRRRRGGRKAPVRKPNYKRRGMRMRRKRIGSKTHMVKRLAQPALIVNDTATGDVRLKLDGNSSFFLGPSVTGDLTSTRNFTMSSQFQLNSVIDASDLTSLFDRYKIVGVKLQFQYLINAQSASVGLVGGNLPVINWAFDGDDAAQPADVNSVKVKGYCRSRVLNANKPLSIYIKPRVSKEIFNSTLTTGYSSERACWLDANSSTIPHFGLKIAITDWLFDGENNNALRIQPTYYLALKDTQ